MIDDAALNALVDALNAQRASLGDAAVDQAIAALGAWQPLLAT